MTKPICIIYFPYNFVTNGNSSFIYEYMRYLNGEKDGIGDNYIVPTTYFTDYYWFCFYKEGVTEPEFKVFHEKGFTEIQFVELKKMVADSLDELKANTASQREK